MNNKTEQLLSWLLGETKNFPFLKEMSEVEMPDIRTLKERRNEEYELDEMSANKKEQELKYGNN